MREIKFRAWLVDEKRWADEIEVYSDGSWMCGIRTPKGLEMGMTTPSAILMEFTGLHDKNGKEIYEGDIVRIWDYGFKDGDEDSDDFDLYQDMGTDVVSLEHFRYWLKNESFGYEGEDLIEPKHCEVIGNIYENPELITEVK